MDTTNKIKSFEDACKALGLNPESLPVVANLPEKDRKSIIAYYKLTIIIRALNEGWEPNWNDWDEYKYFNWFYIDSAGLSYASTYNALTSTNAYLGSRLCFRTLTLARYALVTFEELYLEYLFIEIPKSYKEKE